MLCRIYLVRKFRTFTMGIAYGGQNVVLMVVRIRCSFVNRSVTAPPPTNDGSDFCIGKKCITQSILAVERPWGAWLV